ncbi:MAG: pantoate--beta-alanine ligase [Chloroflexi bacterium]|nr:pantoate--beta-alanine ligase [Chloroflexota bacterium]
MQRPDTIAEARRWRRAQSGRVGFVATMGALHDGHMALLRRSLAETDCSLVSIFLNPLQFGPGEDLDRYPRDIDGDLRLLEAAGADAVFLPTRDVMYPPGFDTAVLVEGPLTQRLEAAHRPTHFRGVTTVVTKLLQVAQADRSYFGMKDAQQLLVLTKLVRDLAIPTTVVPVPTVRAADGLALSSRNIHLDPAQRRASTAITRALDAPEAPFAAGARPRACRRAAARAVLAAEPLVDVQYVSCASLDTLEELDRVGETALVSIAAMVGATHLIDNHWLGLPAGLGAPHADLGLLPPALRSDP